LKDQLPVQLLLLCCCCCCACQLLLLQLQQVGLSAMLVRCMQFTVALLLRLLLAAAAAGPAVGPELWCS
jgi:hypothetical protein